MDSWEWDGHKCGCSWQGAPCWHCESCPECNCSRCDEYHNVDDEDDVCPALIDPMSYVKKE